MVYKEPLTDEEFTKEMQILWQGLDDELRKEFGDIIWVFYNYGERADKIIGKMQEMIE